MIRTVAFLFAKILKGMIDMYFTDNPELRKFEREMRQKPNFDKRNDYSEGNGNPHSPDNNDFNKNGEKEGG